jgi:hypothetical protein
VLISSPTCFGFQVPSSGGYNSLFIGYYRLSVFRVGVDYCSSGVAICCGMRPSVYRGFVLVGIVKKQSPQEPNPQYIVRPVWPSAEKCAAVCTGGLFLWGLLKNNLHKNQTPVHTAAHSTADGHTGRKIAHTYPKRRQTGVAYKQGIVTP